MYHNLLEDSSFHLLLTDIDSTLSAQVRDNLCPYCSGPLHQSNYPRSPLGLTEKNRKHYSIRHSAVTF